MEGPRRTTAAEREREAREDAARKSKLGMRVGTTGVIVLFLGGVATLLLPDWIVAFLGVMVLGILLVLAAFLLMRGSVAEVTGLRREAP